MPMKILRGFGIVVAGYVVMIVLFESFLGLGQPKAERMGLPMLVVTTTDTSGESYERRLALFETEGRMYVSAHHWPRAWYRRALERPEVRIDFEGVIGDYTAVVVEGSEYDRVVTEHPIPLPATILMGFAPRDLLRLDPRS
jgi:hypothetical protein